MMMLKNDSIVGKLFWQQKITNIDSKGRRVNSYGQHDPEICVFFDDFTKFNDDDDNDYELHDFELQSHSPTHHDDKDDYDDDDDDDNKTSVHQMPGPNY